MYSPPKKETTKYCEMFTQVYEQGRELAKQKKLFVNPYPRTPVVNIPYNPYGYDYNRVASFEDELNDWFHKGYYDFGYKDPRYPDPEDATVKLVKPKAKKAKKAVVPIEDEVKAVIKTAVKKKAGAKKINLKTLEKRLKEFEGGEMIY